MAAITVGTSPVQVASHKKARKTLVVQNDSGSAETVYWSYGPVSATGAGGGIELPPGHNASFSKNGDATAEGPIYCATASGSATVRVVES